MTVRYNVSVRSFSFWGDAINTRCVLSDEQCDMVEMVLRNEYGDAISACTLNDIFEYDRDYIANIVGYASFRDLLESDVVEIGGINNSRTNAYQEPPHSSLFWWWPYKRWWGSIHISAQPRNQSD